MVLAGVRAADAVDSARIALRGAGVGEPDLDADLLVAHALGTDRAGLRMDPDRQLGSEGTRWLRDAVRRRAIEREPLAYILGTKGFRHLDLQVDARVLIPRPETEHLVEAVLDLPSGSRVHDVCTGSGAVALALKDERPDLIVTASDVSPDAVAVAEANAAQLGLDVAFTVASLLDHAPSGLDAIVANPPYVLERERPDLAPEITHHEPGLALFAGDEGLDVIRPLLTAAAATTARTVALEIGAGQAPSVRGLMVACGFPDVGLVPDLAGVERIVVGRR